MLNTKYVIPISFFLVILFGPTASLKIIANDDSAKLFPADEQLITPSPDQLSKVKDWLVTWQLFPELVNRYCVTVRIERSSTLMRDPSLGVEFVSFLLAEDYEKKQQRIIFDSQNPIKAELTLDLAEQSGGLVPVDIGTRLDSLRINSNIHVVRNGDFLKTFEVAAGNKLTESPVVWDISKLGFFFPREIGGTQSLGKTSTTIPS